jgi:formate hydrogenlyase subunit 6/NADH:ubiquinone oxidoreductase subunit I
MHYVTRNNFFRLLDSLEKEYELFVPVKKGKTRFYTKYTSSETGEHTGSILGNPVVFGEVRAFEPLKSFFTRGRERVAVGFKEDVAHPGVKPLAVVGAKACDLKGFKIQDYVFRDQDQDFVDPGYRNARDANLIVSADCTCAIDTCFCLALDVRPHPTDYFDLNLSEVRGGFVVESGSKKGESVIASHNSLFADADEAHLQERDEQRGRVTEEVRDNLKKYRIPSQKSYKGIIEDNYESTVWSDEAKTCVECGACNTICPTCHCFLLYDQMSKRKTERYRVWDSCMIKDFAKVAAGVNPRAHLWMRLRNRFEKKFDYFPKITGVYACTGCGRCVSACPAKIDIRKVLQRLVKDVAKQPV